jgi:hypothetical protein
VLSKCDSIVSFESAALPMSPMEGSEVIKEDVDS